MKKNVYAMCKSTNDNVETVHLRAYAAGSLTLLSTALEMSVPSCLKSERQPGLRRGSTGSGCADLRCLVRASHAVV